MGKIPWRRNRLPTPVFWLGEFHGLYGPWGRKQSDTTEHFYFHIYIGASQVALVVKNPPANAGHTGDMVFIPGSGRCPGGRTGNSLQYSCLDNTMGRSLAAYSPWSLKELDMPERLSTCAPHPRTHVHTHTHTRILNTNLSLTHIYTYHANNILLDYI